VPVLFTEKSVVVAPLNVEDEITNNVLLKLPPDVVPAKMVKRANGEEVPMPTLPALVTMKSVFVVEPIINEGVLIPFGFIATRPHGVEDGNSLYPRLDSEYI
jgi:hypothetical protein